MKKRIELEEARGQQLLDWQGCDGDVVILNFENGWLTLHSKNDCDDCVSILAENDDDISEVVRCCGEGLISAGILSRKELHHLELKTEHDRLESRLREVEREMKRLSEEHATDDEQ